RVPNSVANDDDFIMEVANILAQMNIEILYEAHPKTRKAGTDVLESRDSVNPNYFIQYFLGFLGGMGSVADPPRIVKHLRDDVLWMNARNPWRRSPVWLLIRVALRTSLDSTITHKNFMTYYHATILSRCYKHDSFSSDLLYAMRVKMARRLYKIKDTASSFVIGVAKAAAGGTQRVLQGRWDIIQSAQAKPYSSNLSSADFNSAINHTLPHSRSYLEQVFQGHSSQISPTRFTPSHYPRMENVFEFSEYAEGGLSRAFTGDPYLALFDFEASVFDNLASWTSGQQDCSEACTIMSSCFRQYLDASRSYYTTDVADQSIMVLTLMRIWMSIDELATKDCPLLGKYSPELPVDILDPLLLRTTQHIEQARSIQRHIAARHSGASVDNASIFSDDATSASFAVRFFRNSSRHQQLKRVIERHANEQKNKKIKELEGLNAQYQRLNEEIQGMSHEYYYPAHGRQKHSKRCRRCDKEGERNDIRIQPYEWPLPRHKLEAEAVVFELRRPKTFTVWRDITYEILADLGATSSRERCDRYAMLDRDGYHALAPWISASSTASTRVVLASATKPFTQSHYNNTLSIPAIESQVSLDNALQFKLYDKKGDTWAAGPFLDVTFVNLYRHLEYTLESTTHTSNQVIADQHDCPTELSLHEHIAFGTLRSGALLQWMNIVRGLEEDLLTFSSDEVLLLHAQAAWQIGPLSKDGSPQWHEDLSSLEFGCLLVSQCTRMLGRVKANWLQANSVLTTIIIVNRLLASSPPKEVTQAACDFLRQARIATSNWLDQLLDKLQAATHVEDVTSYQHRICMMAIICRATYDVEPDLVDRLLLTPNDYVAFIKCSVALYDNQVPEIQNLPESLQIHSCRDRRFAHKIAPYVLASISRGDDVLSVPLLKVWSGFRQGPTGWRALAVPNNRWITSTSGGIDGDRMQEVHLNIITGQLLIDGKPLGRLPRQYVEHATYIRLFGQKILDVVPAKFPGMVFTTREHVHDYGVSFALEESSGRLVIQARQGDRVYELVSHDKLSGDLPLLLSEEYHHWADLKNKAVEFRHISDPWSFDNCRWHLRLESSKGTTLENSKGGSFLVDIHSSAFKSLSRLISPLESDRYFHVTLSAEDLVEVELPRMKFSFFINDSKQLESRNFRGQILDENQSAGTLLGLKNQLLLRAKDISTRSFPRPRSVLIPDGEIGFTTRGHHVSVSIEFDSRRDVDVYRYEVDQGLGYLATDTGLTGRLFKLYLHALTSYCLPDPLTGRTGTEEALRELSQASTSSFEQINLKQAMLLRAIGLLTPKRKYYPAQLKCMQTIHWTNLPSLSQHFAFSYATAAILRHADTLQLFHPLDFKLEGYLTVLEAPGILLKRAARRTAVYYPSDTTGYVAQIIDSTAVLDSVCPGRDSLAGDWEEAGQAAMWASSLVLQNWGRPVFKPYDLVTLAESWRTLDDQEEHKTLSYHSSWFGINLKSCWISFYNLLRQARVSSNRYRLSACLAGIAFGQTLPTDLIPVFLAFATNPGFQGLDPPSQRLFHFENGYEPTRVHLEELTSTAAFSIESSPANNLVRNEGETDYGYNQRRVAYYNIYSLKYQSQCIDSLVSQWPRIRQEPSVQLHFSNSDYLEWLDVEACLQSTREYLWSCSWNLRFNGHLQNLEAVLTSRPTFSGMNFLPAFRKRMHLVAVPRVPHDPWATLSISNLMHSRLAPNPTDIPPLPKVSVSTSIGPSPNTSCLANLFAEFSDSRIYLNSKYAVDLDRSRRELDSKPTALLPGQLSPSVVTGLNQAQEDCVGSLANTFQLLNSALSPRTDIERIVFVAGIWPRITSRTLLQQLSLLNRPQFDALPEWRNVLIGYARRYVNYQRSQRLVTLAAAENIQEFYKAFDFTSGESDPGSDDPDWLLVQIDANFDIRTVQREVAQEMISPSSGINTVLQLNMGEGKSSVIVPIVATSLADSSRLVRVVVLKPLWRQMFELLVNRISGLANRRIYYLPFGRHIRIDSSSAEKLRGLYEECMREGGILLVQPEHILSFKLMGIDQLITSSNRGAKKIANTLQDMQYWLKDHTRDILDESDEILHVRYQLVYTIGEQQPLDNYPDRWTITQQLLHLAAIHMQRLQKEYPNGLAHKREGHGQFPTLRIMPDCQIEEEQKLVSAIAVDVRNGGLQNLSCDCLPLSSRNILLEFLTNKELPYSQYEILRSECDPVILKGLLIVRGLLASGILVFALRDRHYRVDYGLDLSRSLLAVPYRAKDTPSLRAEFGHPDVAIVLTCLSYYYEGLTDQHLGLCFELLFKLDNPPLEYEQWVKRNGATPDDLKQLNGVNMKDRQQFAERLVPTFSRNSATIDFFLSSVVFPKQAKDFPEKLATSGWDLAEKKHHVTTGFSGTNDNRYLLPTSISQADPVKQLGTNALVLNYLLQRENNFYACMRDRNGESLATEGFLKFLVVQNPEIRVLLDVGAQMLEWQNEELARCWLCFRPDIEAAVYFNTQDELVVLPRNDTPIPLSTSPFAQRLDKCVVYLDNGHTRGTDLKLPKETRALVTLGPKVTKDRLLQGCMRMRKLGHGQSVMFAAPPEIDAQIRRISPNPINPDAPIDVLDVLRWVMLETCKDLQRHISHWVNQAIEFDQRLKAEKRYKMTGDISVLQKGWTTPDSRTLEEMYGVPSPEVLRERTNFMERAFDVPDLRKGLEDLGVERLGDDPSMDEEQEREINHEVEREQQTQNPPKEQPANHSIHQDVQRFVSTGTLPKGRSGIIPLFHLFRASDSQISNGWSPLLFASADFLRTIARIPIENLSEYVRPVNWILSGAKGIRIVLSPYEANELLPIIRNSSVVQLHVYAPRVSLSMLSFSDLRFYSIPASLKRTTHSGELSSAQLQLDLFAGQLYFSSYQDYASLCATLGLFIPSDNEDLDIEVGSDGFVKPEHRNQLIHRHPEYSNCKFTTTPVPALKDLVGRRRKGMSYLLTHVGQILHARYIPPENF
ncbi:hypothetical protein FRC11_000863, partial [Ceratobasidium sp. 423]